MHEEKYVELALECSILKLTYQNGLVLVLYRKKGIASTLLSSCLEGCQEASLHVQTENDNAIQFYKHRGFRIERRISNYYRRVTCLHAFKMILDKN